MTNKTKAAVRHAIAFALSNSDRQVVYLCQASDILVRRIWDEFGRQLYGQDIKSIFPQREIVFPNGSRVRVMRYDEEKRAHGLRIHKIIPDTISVSTFWVSRTIIVAPATSIDSLP